MANNSDTGNGATLTLSDGFTARLTSIDFDEETLEALDNADLLTTGFMKKAPADLPDAGSLQLTYIFRSDQDLPAFPIAGASLTATVTFPTFPGKTTPASVAGTVFLTRRKKPELVNNQLQFGEATFTWDGETGPTYTKAT